MTNREAKVWRVSRHRKLLTLTTWRTRRSHFAGSVHSNTYGEVVVRGIECRNSPHNDSLRHPRALCGARGWQIEYAHAHGFEVIVTNIRRRNARMIHLNHHPDFYEEPNEDAIVMERRIDAEIQLAGS